ncbi:hypothetical protein PG984_012194 [Apiospora sp. TS-2023a]
MVSFLEAAVLSGSRDVAGKAMDLNPAQYTAGALCAAVLIASMSGGDFGIVKALLNNRFEYTDNDPKASYQEMTAIGIAAQSESWDLLELLRQQLPWSHQAITPIRSESNWRHPTFDPLKLPRYFWGGFWHRGTIGSVQMFVAQTEPRIFDLFVNCHYPLTPSCLCLLLLDEQQHDRIRKLVRNEHRAQKAVSHHVEGSPLKYAVVTSDISLVRDCMDLGVDVDVSEGISKSNRQFLRETPLSFSIENGDFDIVELLLERGADVNRSGNGGSSTPLAAACKKGYIGIVMKLLRAGADPNGQSPCRFSTALERAAMHGRLDITHLLLRNGVQTEGTGRLPYIKAVRLASLCGHLQIHELLRSQRQWTKEDEELWNHPALKNLVDPWALPYDLEDCTNDDTDDESSHEGHYSEPDISSARSSSDSVRLTLGAKENYYGKNEENNQQKPRGSLPGFRGIIGDPVLGILDERIHEVPNFGWDDLEAWI